MWREVPRLNLIDLVPRLRMPVFFLLRRTITGSPRRSASPVDALTAPSKKLVWFEGSGHEPFVGESAKFNAAMAELVRQALPPNPPANHS
jgi:hypothetical protein